MVRQTADGDSIDIATESYWSPSHLNERLSHTKPWTEQEDFTIPDLTDQEWKAFAEAIHT